MLPNFVAATLYEIGAIQFGQFRLKLHEKNPDAPLSPYYINLRVLRSYPDAIDAVVDVYAAIARDLIYDLCADVPTSATPIVTLLSHATRRPQITPRLESKSHGLTAQIDGAFSKGQRALLIDDLITTAESKIETIKVLEAHELLVAGIIVLIDREQGGMQALRNMGFACHCACTVTELMDSYLALGLLTAAKHAEIVNYRQSADPITSARK